MGAKQPLADHGNITKHVLPRCARPHGPRVSSEWVGTCWRHGVQSVDLAKYVDTRGSLQRHTLAVQSGFRRFHTGSKLNRCRRAEQHGGPPRFYNDPSLTVVPYDRLSGRLLYLVLERTKKRHKSVGVAASVRQSTSMVSYGSRCNGGRVTQSVTSNLPDNAGILSQPFLVVELHC